MNAITKPRARLKMRCPNRGSEAICKDAWAAWDEKNQRWELGGVYDHETCIECEHEGDDHFDRIDLDTGAIVGAELDQGLPENCVSGEGHEMQPNPVTGEPYCRQCCSVEGTVKNDAITSTGD